MSTGLTLLALLALQSAGPPLSDDERAKIRQVQEEAVAGAARQIEADPHRTDAYSRRGDARFLLGDFKGAVADYDKMVELDGDLAASHWRRGIAYFYAGRHGDAAKQFEAYHSHDDVDRENGIWRYLSQHKAQGREKAREGLLKYKKDDREPFPSVYELFAGRIAPDEILEKIKSAGIDEDEREKRFFYANLYIGLNYAVEGKAAPAESHLKRATANTWARGAGFGPAYMWHVGRLHYEGLCGARAAGPADLRTRKTGSDWPDFLGVNRDSVSSEKGILLKWSERAPKVVWERAVGEGYAIGSVSLGRYFHAERVGRKVRLFALKSETGEELWSFEYETDYEDLYGYDGGPRCSPVVDGERVYLFGPEGMLHCVRAVDGGVVWRKDTTKEFGVVQNFFGAGNAPVVEGDLLIAQVGGSPPKSPGIQTGEVVGLDSGLVAFDKRSGEVKYKVGDDLASYSSLVTATIVGRRWGFAFARAGLVGFEPATGKVDFRHPWRARSIESVNASNPVVVGDKVFISECYGIGGALLKVRPGGYDVVWSDGRKRELSMAAHWMTPIHAEGFLYGSSGRHAAGAELRCIELETGKVRWSEPRLTRCSLLLADGHFVCLGEDGALRLIKVNPEKYEEVGKIVLATPAGGPALKYPAWAAPVLSHGLLYVRGKDRVVCLELIPPK